MPSNNLSVSVISCESKFSFCIETGSAVHVCGKRASRLQQLTFLQAGVCRWAVCVRVLRARGDHLGPNLCGQHSTNLRQDYALSAVSIQAPDVLPGLLFSRFKLAAPAGITR
jgi:hypothetical protein